MQAHEEGGEANKNGYRGAGLGAPGARHVGEHVVVRALKGDAPLFVVAEFGVVAIRSTTIGWYRRSDRSISTARTLWHCG